MLKKEIKYQDFDGNERAEIFYFNLTQAEIAEMELSINGGLSSKINEIIKAEDNESLIRIFKEIISKAYGEKSPDGKYFMKSKEISKAFECTMAYSVLFMELVQDADAATAFMNGIIPVTNPPPPKS